MTNDEQRDAYNEALADLPNCANCQHPYHAGECEYEPGDRWVTGNQPDAPTVLMAMPPCGCRNFEPMTLEDTLEEL